MPGRDLIRQSYRFELAPTAKQASLLGSFAGASRFWFNQGLALVKERLDRRAAGDRTVDVPWSYKSLCSVIAPLKDEICPWRREVVVGSQQAGLEALGRALQNFSRASRAGRRVGFPRYRAKGRCPESVIFQRPRVPDNRHVLLDRRLGPIRSRERLAKLTRLLDRDPRARIVRSTVSRRGERWWISFSVERSPKRRRARRPRSAIGVDLGLASLATLSTGETIANTKPLARSLRALRLAQRSVDRQRRANNPGNYLANGQVKPGANAWRRSRRQRQHEARIRRLHERVANLRREQAHRLTTRLTREHGAIGIESLNITGMLASRRLSRAIADAGWGQVVTQLRYKSAWAGALLIAADTFYPSSKTCSHCETAKAKLSLSERVFACDRCGLVLDRDVNAARNLAKLALRHAQAEGISNPYLAPTEGERLNARGATDPASGSREPLRRANAQNREGSRKGSPRARGGPESTRPRERLALALG
jgi:putative transposase